MQFHPEFDVRMVERYGQNFQQASRQFWQGWLGSLAPTRHQKLQGLLP